VANSLALKADSCDLHSYAKSVDVGQEISMAVLGLARQNDMTTALSLKADETEVPTLSHQVANKVGSSEVNSLIANSLNAYPTQTEVQPR
jgi:hypothetical protein